jgi:RNA polymerase sigma-70 factor (ECF subfamily)
MLDAVLRADGGRITAALAARFRDLDLAEEALAEACARAVAAWADAPPANPAGWLYRVATRVALDALRRRAVRDAADLPPPDPEPTVEDLMTAAPLIPDERLRLIFVCCHPAIHPDARAALTLRLVCGLSAQEIARAFLIAEPALLQRLTRAIADAGVPFEVPGPDHWTERLDAVLSTLEVAYAHAHADGAGTGRHAGYAEEMLGITATLAAMLPTEPEVQALAATVRFAEARRPARIDAAGVMVPLADQDPRLWDVRLITAGRRYLAGVLTHPLRTRGIQALIHAEWCARASLVDPAPWPTILTLYDTLLARRDDPVTRLNRAVALSEVRGPAIALEEVDALSHAGLAGYLPYHALRADLLARLGLADAAREAYDAALALAPAGAERRWLERRRSKHMN